MQLGFLTNSLGKWPIGRLAHWAKDNGFEALEVGASIPLDEAAFRQAVSETGIPITAFIYCRSFLDANADIAATHRKNIRDRIILAGKLGVPVVSMSTGRAPNLSLEMALEPSVEFLSHEILPLARECGVKISIENCPDMSNVGTCPHMWRKLFAQLPEIGLTFDPSHLVRMMIDPYVALREFGDKVMYVHAKDTEILYDRLQQVGVEGPGWWRYRIPGWGDTDWTRIVSGLMEAGYDGVISIEHEDPVWEGTEEKVMQALRLGRDFLRPIWESQ